ncbi:reverse transcriptase domain-containing protein [Tanacetum coccineum]|uniref:Reverse transcriptase domain-containing protein n=1 Tax=Tanacetum coccineum TaxID=301880 RepID=A0ABQ4ZWH8_9ASTR
MLERLAGNEYYCFLDGFSGYFQIPIDPQDQQKTTFTCPYAKIELPHSHSDSDPEDDEEDPEEDPTDYPTDGGDDDDGDDESSDDDEDDDDVEEDEDNEEEEHPTPVDSIPPPIHHRAESPSTSHSLPLPPPIILSHTRASVAMMRAAAPSTYILAPRSETLPSETLPSGTPPLLPIPLPTPSPPLILPSTDQRVDMPRVCLPPQKRLCIALGPRYKVGESSSAPTARPTGGFRVDYGFVATLDDEIRRDPKRYVGYGIIDTWDDMVEDMQGTPPAIVVTGLSQRMADFVTTVRQDTDEIYVRLDNAQDDRSLMSGRLNMLFRDRRAHACTALLMEREARLSREAWGRSMDASDIARSEVRALRTTVLAQQTKIAALRAADRARQPQLMEILRLMSTLQTQKMAPKRTARANPADTTATNSVTNAQLKAMIDQGVTHALAARDADRNTNGVDSHNLGTGALTWWNSHVRTVGHDVAYAMTWTYMKKKMTDKYCPRGEIKKLEAELWNLKVKGSDMIESDKIERFVSGLPDMIHGSVVASKPKIMQEAIEIATEPVDKKIRTFAEPQGHFKRDCPKLKNNNRGNQGRNGNAPAKVYAVGRAGTNPDSNVITGTFLLNNRYASVLFDTGADRSFVSTAFSS